MVFDSIMPHAECGQNDHRKDAPRLPLGIHGPKSREENFKWQFILEIYTRTYFGVTSMLVGKDSS